MGELERAHADAGERVSGIPFGRHPEVALAGQVEVGIERLEPLHERAPEACIIKGDVARLAVAPVLEATDDDGAMYEVDHRAGAERRDELALTELALRAGDLAGVHLLARRRHQRLSSSCLKLSHTSTLGSTSRIEVGTWKHRAS